MFNACEIIGVCVCMSVLMWQNRHLCEHSALLNLGCPLTRSHTLAHIHTLELEVGWLQARRQVGSD